MKIVPAILSRDLDECLKLARLAASFTNYVQIDIMDGLFVPTRSFPPESLNGTPMPIEFELHLMVADPLTAVRRLSNSAIKKVIFHIETSNDHSLIIEEIRNKGISPGIAVKPETGLDSITESATLSDTILFMAVDPGDYGSPFRPEVLDKMSRARKLFSAAEIGIDGGVSFDNPALFANRGVDYVCVGSRIFRSESPGSSYLQFTQRLGEIEAQDEF